MAKWMNPKLTVCWDPPQWPNQWIPNLWCSVIPNGQIPNSWSVRIHTALPSVMAKRMDPKSQHVGILNGQTNGSQTCGALWFLRARSQTQSVLGSPVTKWVDPKVTECWDPQWAK